MRIQMMLALLTGRPVRPGVGGSGRDATTDRSRGHRQRESAAPAAVSKDAAVVTIDAEGHMTVVREGSNGFTCMPDVPETPGADPMCGDAGAMKWTDAWLARQDPPAGVVGFGYMLVGGSDPDNLDPFAMTPPEGRDWVTTGPHVMLFNIGEAAKDYPGGEKPDTSKPYVMYPDTPYAHITVPVQ